MDYDNLTIRELEEILVQVEAAIKEKHIQEIEMTKSEVLELIDSKGLKFEELFPNCSR